MVQLNFLNAQVNDDGNGLEVNGRSLEAMISAALGTIKRVPGRYDWLREEDKLKPFSSDLCNVSVTIDDRSEDMTEILCFSGADGKVEEVDFSEFLGRLENEHTEETEPGSEEE